jgi:hypothetical protein
VRRPVTEVGRIRTQCGSPAVAPPQDCRPRRSNRSISASDSTTSVNPMMTAGQPGTRTSVVLVRLEADEVLAAHAGQLRPGPGPEDHVRSIREVVDRQDDDLTVREKADPPYGG